MLSSTFCCPRRHRLRQGEGAAKSREKRRAQSTEAEDGGPRTEDGESSPGAYLVVLVENFWAACVVLPSDFRFKNSNILPLYFCLFFSHFSWAPFVLVGRFVLL